MANRVKAILMAMILVIITSCSYSDVSMSEVPVISETDNGTFFIKSIVWTEKEFYKNTDSWEQYIKDTFEISIKVKQIIRNPMEPFNFSGVINKAGDEGIVFFNDARVFYQFANNGALLNLNGYLDSLSYIDTRGSLYSNVYKLDNQIYGIPIEENLYFSSRLYYSEWLGGEDPKEIDTISELYDYIYKVTYNDLDHNYENDTPGLTVNIWKINEELPDISKSFGCYFPFNDTKSLSYNPITDSFEDTVFSPNFKEYIMFLKDMSDKKMMVTDAYDKGEILASDNPNINPLMRFRKPVATFWGRLINYANSSEYSVGSVFFEGSNETYLHEIEGFYGFKCYGILAGTDNPADYLNLINEALSTDDRYYLALMYGVPDLDYKIYEGNRISYMLDDTSLNIDAPHKGIYSHSVNKIPAYQGNYDQIYSQYEEKITIYKSIVEQLDYRKSYTLPFENTFQYLSESEVIGGNMPEYINIIMNPVFNDGAGVDVAIDEYKRLFFIAGLDFKLTELNGNIGSQTAFEYNRYN